ncbi:class I SAM-dependent methyltransferase [Marivita sp. S2033]|uniref:class I SAM-dependent methyltransferase n=1 Tax=Marivita sp. S2033 TaxID=3373187 RepID=UPI003981F163
MYRAAKFWDRTAEKYAAMPVRNPEAYAALLDMVRGYLNPKYAVLELGCGTGSTAIVLAPDVARFVATDVSEAMLDKGREKARDQGIGTVEFVHADAADAPPGPFDVVLAFNLLHLIEDRDAAMAEIASRLRPGGLFISKTFCMPERRNLIWFLIKTALPVLQAVGRAPYFGKLSPDELEALITSAGFTIVDTQRAAGKDPRRTIVARRDG